MIGMWKLAPVAAALLVGTVIRAPWDKAHAQCAPVVPVESDAAAPLHKVRSSEDVGIVSSAPNQEQWFDAYWVQPPINEVFSPRYFHYFGSCNRLRGEEKRFGIAAVAVVRGHRIGRSAPVQTDCHILRWRAPTIFPTRLNGEAREEEVWISLVLRGQLIPYNRIGMRGGGDFCVESIQENESPFSCLQSVLGDTYRLTSGNPQADSRSGKSNCGERRDGSAPLIQERSEAELPYPSMTGDIFFKGLAGGAFIIGLYAFLKKVGTKYYPKNYKTYR